jgi:hypothetical protein
MVQRDAAIQNRLWQQINKYGTSASVEQVAHWNEIAQKLLHSAMNISEVIDVESEEDDAKSCTVVTGLNMSWEFEGAWRSRVKEEDVAPDVIVPSDEPRGRKRSGRKGDGERKKKRVKRA